MTVLLLDSNILKPIVLILLLSVGVYSFFSKSIGLEDDFKGVDNRMIIMGSIFAFFLWAFMMGFFWAWSRFFYDIWTYKDIWF